MNRFQRALGKICDNCPLCNYARSSPESPVGRAMAWHGRYCPAWKAQRDLAAARDEKSLRKSGSSGDEETPVSF